MVVGSKQINIDGKLFNEKYLPYVNIVRSYEVYYGGSGSGKSYFVSDKLAIQMSIFEGRNLVCLRSQKTDCLNSCLPSIRRSIRRLGLSEYWKFNVAKSKLENIVNGNQILFEGADDIEDIKSISFYSEKSKSSSSGNLTDVWYEEVNQEGSVDTIRELARRLRDSSVQTRIVLSFNPVSKDHWLFNFVEKERRGIYGDVRSIKTCYDSFDDDNLILHSTYRDNRFLPESYGIELDLLKHTSPYDYMVYTLGDWGVMGQSVFDTSIVGGRLTELLGISYSQGSFMYMDAGYGYPVIDSRKFVDSVDGDLRIFKPVEDRVPYVLVVDTAGDGSDYYAGHVFNNISGEQCAVYYSQASVDECVKQIYLLAHEYNNAMVVPEVNFDMYLLKYLLAGGYTNIYRRCSPTDSTYIRRTAKHGWYTDASNRQTMLSELVNWVKVQGNIGLINDIQTLEEMLVFTRQTKGNRIIWQAEPGSHDDLVISLAIFLQTRWQQSMEYSSQRLELSGYYEYDELRDMLNEGRIDMLMYNDYIQKNKHIREDSDYNGNRRSRYARSK